MFQAGSGLLSGDMSAAFPESKQRAEDVLRHTSSMLQRDDNSRRGDGNNAGSGGGSGPLTTEVCMCLCKEGVMHTTVPGRLHSIYRDI